MVAQHFQLNVGTCLVEAFWRQVMLHPVTAEARAQPVNFFFFFYGSLLH